MIEKLIKNIAQRLDKDEIPYMIIGGQALNKQSRYEKQVGAPTYVA